MRRGGSSDSLLVGSPWSGYTAVVERESAGRGTEDSRCGTERTIIRGMVLIGICMLVFTLSSSLRATPGSRAVIAGGLGVRTAAGRPQLPRGAVVLVTGGAGFVGLHLCLRLQREHVRVVALDSLTPYYSLALKAAAKRSPSRFLPRALSSARALSCRSALTPASCPRSQRARVEQLREAGVEVVEVRPAKRLRPVFEIRPTLSGTTLVPARPETGTRTRRMPQTRDLSGPTRHSPEPCPTRRQCLCCAGRPLRPSARRTCVT